MVGRAISQVNKVQGLKINNPEAKWRDRDLVSRQEGYGYLHEKQPTVLDPSDTSKEHLRIIQLRSLPAVEPSAFQVTAAEVSLQLRL